MTKKILSVDKQGSYFRPQSSSHDSSDLCEEEASKVFKWFPSLTDDRQRAIINMVFNLGLTKLLHFKKFLAAMEAGDYETAGKEMLDSKWARQVGNRSDRLEQMIVNG